ncbi:MAG: hypothetical protein KA794_20830, partial [Candidatus Obscuribacter sp.]|nr:hypothetical protein [Candidatus Obscuribacter sp.]
MESKKQTIKVDSDGKTTIIQSEQQKDADNTDQSDNSTPVTDKDDTTEIDIAAPKTDGTGEAKVDISLPGIKVNVDEASGSVDINSP